ncbi:MAG TPA: endospore germination permease [Clostridiaceae bacterium]|nr:endospore germination permease [Clostridiaceae bacterium]
MSIEKGKISNQQLLFLVAGFVLGSVLLVDFTVGITEHQTWMVILAGLAITAPVILSYVVLAKKFPGMNLVQINDMVYGRFLGKVISIYYIFFFSMTLSFNIRDVGELYITFLMQDTPFIFFLIVFTATCAYAVSKGIEVLARVSHLFVVSGLFVIVSAFTLLIDQMDFSNFLPFFELPFIRIFQGIHIVSVIPYGETVVFLMIMGCLNKTDHAVKKTFSGLLIGAVSLLIVAVRNTAVLGRTQTIWTSTSFQSIRLINIGTVLTRMDFLIGIAQTILIFFKCSLFFYALVVALSQLFGLKSYLPLVLPLAGIEVIIAATVFQSPVDHAMITLNAGIIYSAPLIFVFPPLSLLIAKIRGLPKLERGKGI